MSAEPKEAVVVANPGHVPWMAHTAAALESAGFLRAYVAPALTTHEELSRLRRALPAPLAGPILSELRRREVPRQLSRKATRVATAAEITSVGSKRLRAPSGVARRLADRRDRRFDTGVRRLLRRDDQAAFVAYGAALRSADEARRLGIETLLEYPVAHHRFAQAILQEEQRLQPAFAETMQFHYVPPARRAHLEAEIDAVDRVLVLSSFHRRTFVDAGVDEDRLVLNPFGVDLERFKPRTTKDGPAFRVLFVGQITQRKGISYLLEGFRRAALPYSELLLVGRPHRTVAPWAGQPNVRHVDMLPPWEIPEVYAQADVLVLPSLVEGLARVILEAMASGLPVIATPNTGAEDVLSDGVEGYIVPIRDSGAIAEGLRHLYNQPEDLERMRSAARRRAEQFTWDRYKERAVAAVAPIRNPNS